MDVSLMSREDFIEKIVDYEAGDSTADDYSDWSTDEILELYNFYFGV